MEHIICIYQHPDVIDAEEIYITVKYIDDSELLHLYESAAYMYINPLSLTYEIRLKDSEADLFEFYKIIIDKLKLNYCNFNNWFKFDNINQVKAMIDEIRNLTIDTVELSVLLVNH